MRVVPSQNKDTLLAIIKDSILPGTTLVSNCWWSYNCLKDEGYVDLAVNQSIKFKDTNSISRRVAIERIMPENEARNRFDSYLAEYFWRRSRAGCRCITREFLNLLAQAYNVNEPTPQPPPEESSSEHSSSSDNE